MVTIVIASYKSNKTIARCVRSLLDQKDVQCNITVVDSSSDSTNKILSGYSDRITVIKRDHRTFAGTARNIGIQNTTGAIIGFIDADCVVDPGWVDSIERAFEDDSLLAAGGSIRPYPTMNPVSHAEYLLEFSEFLPGSPRRHVTSMPHCNIAYRREVFDRFGMIPDISKGQDTLFNRRLERAGVRILFNPDMKVYHICRTRLRDFLWQQYNLGKGFVDTRMKDSFRGSRAVKNGLFPVLAFYRILLTFLRISKWGRRYLLAFPLLLPFMCAGLCAWCAGGYVRLIQTRTPEDAP